MAIQTAGILKHSYGISIDEDEVYKLAMIMQPVFGKYPFNYKKEKAIVISDINKSVASELCKRLQRNFDTLFEDFIPCNLYELKKMDLNQYTFIFTSLPDSYFKDIPKRIKVEHIDVFFDEDDKARLRNEITKGIIADNNSETLIANSLHVYECQAKSKKAVIQEICDIVEREPGTLPKISDSIDQAEEVFASQDDKNLVYISPIEWHTKNSFVGLFVLKHPITWKKGKIQLVIYWDRGKCAKESKIYENELLPHLLAMTLKNKKVVNQLLISKDPQMLLEELSNSYKKIVNNGKSFR